MNRFAWGIPEGASCCENWYWATKGGRLLSGGREGGRGFGTQQFVYLKWPDQIFPVVNFVFPAMVPLVWGGRGPEGGGGVHGGGLARGHGVGLCAFGGAYWPLATAHSDPLWARTCFGCVNGAPG